MGKIEIKILLFPDEDDVEEFDGANDGESVGEAQHAANVGDEGGHTVRLHNVCLKFTIPQKGHYIKGQ